MIRGWYLILPGCRWLYDLGFPHRAGRYRPGAGHRFRHRFDGVQMYGRIADPGMGPCPTRVALALRAPG